MSIREMIRSLIRCGENLLDMSRQMKGAEEEAIFTIIGHLNIVIDSLEEMEELERIMTHEKKTV